METLTEELVQQAQEKNYVDFKEKALEMLRQKTAEKLAEKGYFKKLDQAKGIFEAEDEDDKDKDEDGKEKDDKDTDKDDKKDDFKDKFKKEKDKDSKDEE
jgi:hypothetical protein